MGRSRSRDRDRDRDGGEKGEKREKDDRKGEKKEKKKKRSRSSESAERSREREKRRRKQQHDLAKQSGKANAGPGGMAALGNAGAPGGAPGGMGGGMPGVTTGQQMFWDGFQWVPRAAGATGGNDVNATRKLRRLYLGNLPYHLGVTEDSFSTQLYNTMKAQGLCNDPEQNPVMHVWFAREKGANYGFVEMASVEETERALQLDGMMVCGVPVTIKRINDSTSPLAAIANAAAMRPGMPGMPPAPGMPGSHMLALPQVLATATSKIIRSGEILKYDAKTAMEDFEDVVEDMNEGCGAHGKLGKAYIIRPDDKLKLPGPDFNIGDVFMECASIEDATKIMRAMGHRKYDGRPIQMKSFEEDMYERSVKAVMGG